MSALLKTVLQSASDPESWANEGLRDYPWVEESRKSAPGLDDLLKWAHSLKASRIDLKTGHRATVKIHGQPRYATVEALPVLALKQIVDHIYGADGSARISIGHEINTAYSVILNRRESLRFRLNICPVSTLRGAGIHIIMRPITPRPATLDEQGVEPEIRDTNAIQSGMVFFGGATGSGKSTLQFGLAEAKLMDPDTVCGMATGEAPIEFLLDYLRPPNGNRISQTEMRPPIMTFADFTRSCTRREMTDVIVGECNTGDTMEAAINCAMMGGKLSTTIHADTVPLMIQRAVALCPRAERDNLVSAMGQSLRFMINQRLLPRVGGGRVAIREYLTLDNSLRRKMLRAEMETWPELIAQAVESEGQTYARAITKALEAGHISEKTALIAQRRDA